MEKPALDQARAYMAAENFFWNSGMFAFTPVTFLLSLQMHHHRSEHWIVVKGTVRVTIGDNTPYVHENETIYVPKSTLHLLEKESIWKRMTL